MMQDTHTHTDKHTLNFCVAGLIFYSYSKMSYSPN